MTLRGADDYGLVVLYPAPAEYFTSLIQAAPKSVVFGYVYSFWGLGCDVMHLSFGCIMYRAIFLMILKSFHS